MLLPLTILLSPADHLDDTLGAWRACLTEKAKRYAPLGEPAETVATAALSACKEHERELRAVPQATAYPELIKTKQSIVDGMVKDERGRLIQLVLEERLRKP